MTHNLYLKMTRKGPTGEIFIGEHGEQEDQCTNNQQQEYTKIEYHSPPFPHMFASFFAPPPEWNKPIFLTKKLFFVAGEIR